MFVLFSIVRASHIIEHTTKNFKNNKVYFCLLPSNNFNAISFHARVVQKLLFNFAVNLKINNAAT